jgi:hypothetical protein
MNQVVLSPHPTLVSRRLRLRLLVRSVMNGLGAVLLVTGFLSLLSLPRATSSLVLVVGVLVVLVRVYLQQRRLRTETIAGHLNRTLAELEESAGLLMHQEPGSPMQRLQAERTRTAWPNAMAQTERWLPRFNPLGALIAIGFGAWAILSEQGHIEELGEMQSMPRTALPGHLDGQQLELSVIRIAPPAYTRQPPFESTQWDIRVPEGSEVTWVVEHTSPDGLLLQINDETPTRFAGSSAAEISRTVFQTSLYRILSPTADGDQALGAVHTLSVERDHSPRLRVLAPNERAIEFRADAPPVIEYRVGITDDHGLESVEIRASLASGLGEGVKFRDMRYAFDRHQDSSGEMVYTRQWDLPSLGMKPGDEIYFFTVAQDARSPEANTARSDTVVIRWLDDVTPPAAASGMAMDVLPEYFRSQRQIIIETEQLIARLDQLETERIDAESRELGQAQQALKQRYGQYLGDEFDEDFVATGEDAHSHESDHDDHAEEKTNPARPGHNHETDDAPGAAASDAASRLIAQFGHDHGSADEGPVTANSAGALMKRAISHMWQAERFLLMSAPSRALPFEYDALDALNLARQADRIYTQRLGFEPPPVSEDRRLSGKLDEVRSRSRLLSAPTTQSDTASLVTLNNVLQKLATGRQLDASGLSTLRMARQYFLAQSQQRPELIQIAALLEQTITLAALPPDCEGCVAQIQQATWRELPPPEAEPRRNTYRSPGQPVVVPQAATPGDPDARPGANP